MIYCRFAWDVWTPPPSFWIFVCFRSGRKPLFCYRFSLQYVSMPTTDILLIGRRVGWGDGTYDRGGHRTSTFLSRILPGVISSTLELWKTCLSILLWSLTSSTTQGGGGSFKNRKPIGEFGCCESRMAERRHWWMDRFCLFLSFFFSDYLSTSKPTYLSIYQSIWLAIYLSVCLAI